MCLAKDDHVIEALAPNRTDQALETAFRYSSLDLTEGTVDGGDLEILSLGINWWLARRAQFSVDYRYISLDRLGIVGHSSGLNVRLLLMLD